jgi:hypothetical protein
MTLKYLQSHPETYTTTIFYIPPYTPLMNQKRSDSAWTLLAARKESPMISPIASPSNDDSPVNVDRSGFFPTKFSPLADAVIPARYTSKSDCESGTKNCTLHGSCTIVAKEDHADHVTEWWACICKAQVKKLNGGGTQTTYYAGNACQKIDVSFSFWLLAGVSVGLLTVVSMGIGLLYTMGAEELPSVIGAGVSSARK